jgi:hypothetical protein
MSVLVTITQNTNAINTSFDEMVDATGGVGSILAILREEHSVERGVLKRNGVTLNRETTVYPDDRLFSLVGLKKVIFYKFVFFCKIMR